MPKGFNVKHEKDRKTPKNKSRNKKGKKRSSFLNEFGFPKNKECKRQEYIECSDCHHVVYTTIRDHWEKCAKCGSENVFEKTKFYEDSDRSDEIVKWIEENNLTMCIETEEDLDIESYHYDPGWGWSAEAKDGMIVGF